MQIKRKMETINEDFYKAEGLLDLIKICGDSKLKPRRLWLRRLALLENLNNYYRFAVGSVRLFQESFNKNLELISKGEGTKDNFDDESHSSALSFYSHGRVCIESSRLLSDEAIFYTNNEKKAEALQEHRDKYAAWARDIIEKRNEIVAHPHNTRKMITGSPNSWGSSGELTFFTVDLEHITIKHDEYKLEPIKNLKELKNYIEETIAHLSLIWGINFTSKTQSLISSEEM